MLELSPARRTRTTVALLILSCAAARAARAEEPASPATSPEAVAPAAASPEPAAAEPIPGEPPAPTLAPRGFRWQSPVLFLGGAATAFLAHESGHLVTNYALGNEPTFTRVRYLGTIPFFAIDPGIHCQGDRCIRRNGKRFGPGPRGLFLIETAGIQVQQYTDELILTQDPRLRDDDAPFRKGMLAFNTLTSIAYVVSNMAGTEPPNGDLRGVYRDVGAPRNAMNFVILGVAGLDIARYWFPDARWLAWLSRAGKVVTTGIVFTI